MRVGVKHGQFMLITKLSETRRPTYDKLFVVVLIIVGDFHVFNICRDLNSNSIIGIENDTFPDSLTTL